MDAAYALVSVYPNPFNAFTTIEFELPNACQVSLDIYNIAGRKVDVLVEGFHSAGVHSVNWDASSYSSGVYFCKLKAENRVFTHKVVLMK
ncbi:MAG: T9SS type A sorting domain-containing protein [candidate division Zixibacteria bacterium]|nr:T9SS type A sorting domain-containing protein [candidate division Zixibacteria bacterium]